MTTKFHNQKGAVSIFVVIFAALLMSIVAISFVRLMTTDQQQATTTDLSQSAYDSAQAGVEDAKRLLLLDQACRNNTAASNVNCLAVASALNPSEDGLSSCSTLSRSGLVSETNNEVLVQQTAGDADLDQAYTCVRIAKNTNDYLGNLQANESIIVPLRGERDFRSVELSWFSEKDLSSQTGDPTVDFPGTGANVQLPQNNQWQYNYPALMRAQVIQTGASFTLDNFDSNEGGKSNANTLFLYPASVGATEKDYALDARRTPPSAPQPISCRSSLEGGGYACKVTLRLLNPIDGDASNRTAFLRLSALYNRAHFTLALKDGSGNDVKFSNVQPEVDSTGRANNLFRRVLSRVELKGNFAYPQAEIDVAGDLCKNFTITSNQADFRNNATNCNP